MKPAAFSYHRAPSLEEALRLLAEHGDAAKVIAGGQSLAPMMNMRLAAPAELIDLSDLGELAYIRETNDAVEIGALTRHFQMAESELVQVCCPLLAQATVTIGHYAIRQRGTLGGSLAHADPAAQLPLVAATLGAKIDIASTRGRRTLAARDFFVSVMTTALASDEIVVAVRFPKAVPNEGAAFELFSRRHGDFAIVAAAMTVVLQGNRATGLRLGLGGIEAVPLVPEGIAQRFAGRSADAAWVAEVARAAREAANPEDDARIPAEYRKELTETLVARSLTRALGRARGLLA
jgi:carbon-monoxide dehydrogenase medium subunit